MKKFLIAEAEKSRILGMHYKAMGKSLVNEAIGEPGTIKAVPREQNLVDKGMSYIGLDYYDAAGNKKQYYYHCTPYVYTQKEYWNVPGNRAGDFTDGDNNFIGTASKLGLKGDYNTQLKNACQNIYTFYNNYKKTFCADPKNKTKDAYEFLCPKETPQPQVAAATTTTVNAPNPVSDADVAASQKRDAESKAKQQSTLANTQTKMTSWMSDTTFLSPEKDKAALDSEVNQVSLIIGDQNTGLSDEQKMFLKRKIKNLVTLKPEYGRNPYYLNTNF